MQTAGHVGKYSYDYMNRAPDKREYLVLIRDNFCLFCTSNLRCDPSSEPSQRDGSDEGSQHMV